MKMTAMVYTAAFQVEPVGALRESRFLT